MPEGHTLHRLAHDLDDAFAGTAPRASSPQGRFEDGAALLDGRAWRGASAWGKHLFVAFDGDLVLHVHLGLYGKFHVHAGDYAATGAPDPVGQVRLRLLTADRLAELRGATACEVLTPAEAEAIQARLGPDPLRPLDELNDPERAWHRVHRSRTAIGPLIMDQAVLAGVGNVYRSEVLFRHRLDPAKLAPLQAPDGTLTVRQLAQALEDQKGDEQRSSHGVSSGPTKNTTCAASSAPASDGFIA